MLLGYPGVRDLLSRSETEREQTPGEEPGEKPAVQHDAEGRTIVNVDPNTQARMGLKTESLTAAETPAQVEGWGHVLDPAPLAALVTEAAATQASLQASVKEYERVNALYSRDQNASARALEAAEAAMSKDRIELASVHSRLVLGWGGEIAAQADLPAFVQSLASRQNVLIRVDLPLGEEVKTPPAGGHVALAGEPLARIEARVLGPAPSVDPQTQGRGYLLLAKGESLPFGSAVVAWLTVSGKPLIGVEVPEAAIVRYEGRDWVYVSMGPTAFSRRPVVLSHPVEGGWLVTGGLAPGDRIVVGETQMLLSEELKSSINLGD